MKIYQVGGCVRDKLLGLEPKDIDYVVVGSSEAEMLKLGYTLVGKDFPVFLHPETGCEYALARKEKKVSAGYGGFETDVNNVSLKEDLFRRDLTINAISMDSQGQVIDPYGGAKDLSLGILRHVSDHFAEDPVRILRIARFNARYNFKIADETYELMDKMVKNGEFDQLTKERVWKELEKAISEPYLKNFFVVLEDIHALKKLFSFDLLPQKDFFNSSRTFEENLCHIFSSCPDAEIKKWKMPETQQQIILNYKKYQYNAHFYSEMNSEDRLKYIMLTKGMHQPDYSIKILNLVMKYQNYQNSGKDSLTQGELLLQDIQRIKSLDYEQLVLDVSDKKAIGFHIKQNQLNALNYKTIKPKF